eukprot:TRINITY_DN7533_c1_g1_i1.p1 TRINITY_DN7533_c1_g1~~TRINITY_DN7533_c1_g1_i1.p1  ORF type:complete len:898 (+),score=206.19 TRINITY_DN7533_c1_g1_i1:41-2695(+)
MPFSSSWAATPPPPGSQERASVDRQFSVGGAKFSPEVKASLDVIHKYIRGEPLLQQGGGGSLFDDLPMAAQPDGLPVAPAAQEKEAPPPSVQRHGSAVRKPFEFTPQSSPVSAPGSCRRTHPGRAPAARPLPSQTFAAVDPSCTFKSISPHRRSEDLAPQGQGQATRHEGLHDASTAAPPPSAHVTPQAVPVRDAPSAAPYYPPLSDAAPPLAPRLSSVPSAAPAGDVFDSKNVVQPPMQSGPPMPSNPPSAASTGAPAAGPRYRTLTLMEVVNFLRWHYSTDKDAEARLLENGDGLDTLEEDEVVALTECLTEDLIQLKHAGGGAAAVVAPPSDAAPTSSIPVRNTRTPSREPEFAAAPAAAAAATAPNSLAAPSPRSDAPQEPIVRRHLRGERVVVDTTSAPHQASSPAVSSVAPVPALAAPVDPSPPTVPLTGPTATGSETAQDPPSVPVSHTASMMSTGAARDGDGGEQFLSSTLAAAAAVGEQDELVMSVAEPSPEPCPAAAPPAPVAVDDDDDDHDLVSNETSERYSMSRSPSPVPHENLAQPRVLQQAHHVQPSGAAAVKGQGGRPQVSTAHIPQQPQPSERLSASIKNPPTPPAHPAAPVKIPSVHPTQSASSTPQPQQPTPDRRPPQSARPPVAAPQPAQPHSQLENAPPPRTQTPPAPAMLKAPHSAPRPSTPQQPPLPQTPTGQPMSVPPGTPRTVAALAAVRQEIAYLHPKLGALHVLKYNATSSGRGPRWLGIDITESGLNLVVAKGHSLLAQPNSNRKAHKLESLVGVVTGAHNPNLLEDKAWAKHRASGRALKGPAVKGLASGERLSPEGCFTLRFGGSALGGERKAFNFYSSDAKLHLWVTFFSLMVQFNTQQANAQAQAQAQAQAKG